MRSLIMCLMLATASMTAATVVSAFPAQATTDVREAPVPIHYRTAKIDGLDIFYREAGPGDAPVVLLLHGFPTSSHMFRNLIPLLADRYHVIAPDYPGYGQSATPDRSTYAYTFAATADIVDKLMVRLEAKSYAMYVMDYGAPVGYRLALKHPERVSGLIIQNGNAYDEGLKEFWDPIKTYWSDGSAKSREALSGLLTLETTKFQYTDGMEDVSRISPDNWVHDQTLLDRPGNKDIQLDMLYDYRTNVPLYPDFQRFFRERKPPTLIVWGKNDFIFPEAGA
ncbi:MAG: alpha/beta hydrolase, partial [Rhizobium altiplani]|uniref:alpha/beta fold hydrolase n=1 Tax=Rhizobium altiplani TaxID=1864509 RepID=UPI0030F1E41D